jgi:hypothetical protein
MFDGKGVGIPQPLTLLICGVGDCALFFGDIGVCNLISIEMAFMALIYYFCFGRS